MRRLRENGMDAYVPLPAVVVIRNSSEPGRAVPAGVPYRAVGRDAVIAHSRATYARTRKEVEREIAALNGWPNPHPETTEEQEIADLQVKLSVVGLPRDQISILLAGYDRERIRRQLEWLPYRNAIRPAKFLVAAIAKDFGSPKAVPYARSGEQMVDAKDADLAGATRADGEV